MLLLLLVQLRLDCWPVGDATNWAHTHTHLTALFQGLPGWAGTRTVKPIWILLKQETVSGSGIIWAICKSAPRSRQITMPAPQHSVFYRPDALPAAQPTASKHWRPMLQIEQECENECLPQTEPECVAGQWILSLYLVKLVTFQITNFLG